jgi:hypothetical protein
MLVEGEVVLLAPLPSVLMLVGAGVPYCKLGRQLLSTRLNGKLCRWAHGGEDKQQTSILKPSIRGLEVLQHVATSLMAATFTSYSIHVYLAASRVFIGQHHQHNDISHVCCRRRL